MLGFIGGSGLYQIEEISNVEFVTISSSSETFRRYFTWRARR